MSELEIFFTRRFDIEEFEEYYAMESNYNKAKLLSYIHSLINIPFANYLDYVRDHDYDSCLLSSDIPQFSSLESATIKICSILKGYEHLQSFTFDEIGKLLLDDRYRTPTALKKYGENHVKIAVDFGLCIRKGHKFVLSPLGFAYPELEHKDQIRLLARLVLRHKFVYRIIHKVLNGQFVSIADEIAFLSSSTITRRKGNCLLLCKLILENQEIDTSHIISQIS